MLYAVEMIFSKGWLRVYFNHAYTIYIFTTFASNLFWIRLFDNCIWNPLRTSMHRSLLDIFSIRDLYEKAVT